MPLNLDLPCGTWRETFPFRVEVLETAIDHLIADAREAHRVYELMMIRRPGDVWKYLWTRLIEVPESVTKSIAYRMKRWDPPGGCRWPDGYIPFTKFDSLFYWCYEDTEPDSEAWLSARQEKDFIAFGDGLFDRVCQAQATLRSSDDALIQAELVAIDQQQHYHDRDAEPPLDLTANDYLSPILPKRSAAYYQKLAELLARPDVRMVSSRGDEDYQTVRKVCEAQRLRALASGKSVDEALPFHILADRVPLRLLRRWRASFIGWGEGLGYADLLLDGDLNRGLSHFIERPYWATRLALTHHPETCQIPGFTRTEGDGWVLYEDQRRDMNYAERIQESFDEYMKSLFPSPQA